MNLKPQDILVMLKLVVMKPNSWSYNKVAIDLDMSPSEVHAAVKRALKARLAFSDGDSIQPMLRNLEEFICHGLKYVFVVEYGQMERGIATAHAAEPLSSIIVSDGEPVPVWTHPEGPDRGLSISPLYKAAPYAALKDRKLYELLALIDAIRIGRARESQEATSFIRNRLNYYQQ